MIQVNALQATLPPESPTSQSDDISASFRHLNIIRGFSQPSPTSNPVGLHNIPALQVHQTHTPEHHKTSEAMATGIKRKRAPKPLSKRPDPRTQIKEIPNRNITAEIVPRPEEMGPQLQRIAASDRTVFEKKVWTLLCQIPPGSVSTYGLMASHLGSSPRAVGNALRRNPFAPQVPCHRVVATGGALGGFKGYPSKNGEGVTIGEKKSLLRKEGVKIDEKGRVLGTPWSAFVS
ncbi:6-O-methylguanine DNA methyltransferase [Ustulina deusta]|nr:6-O-methylguanine DNA methyltransferase [Ustulina deusta]